jgi:hypothetical protein
LELDFCTVEGAISENFRFSEFSFFSTPFAYHQGRLFSHKSRRKQLMSEDAPIFKHLMQKHVDNAEYWREILILEEGPYVFRVIQELQVGQTDVAGERKRVRPATPNRMEWICSSRQAATEQALRCLHQSRTDNWVFPPAATSAA